MFKVISNIFLFTIVSNQAFASQLTTIITSRATIYADRQLSTPIGYLTGGQQVRVGEGLKRGGKILPIITDGKLTYIKVEDLALREKYQGITSKVHRVKHDTSSNFKDDKAILTNNTFIVFNITNSTANQASSFTGDGTRTSSGSTESDGIDPDSLSLAEYTIYLEHRNPYGRLSWGLGIGFLQSTKTGETLESFLLRGSLATSFYQSHYLTTQVAFEPFFSGDVFLGTVPTTDPNEPNEKLVGLLYGYRFALQARILPLYRFSGIVGVGIEKTFIKQSRGTEQVKDFKINISGTIIYAGLSYKFQ